MPKRAILYARVSTPAQAKRTSLDYQIEVETEYAERNGFEVVAVIKDDQSGTTMEKRDGLTEARQLLQKGEADILVTFNIDRMHRNFINHVLLRDEIQRLGAELHYASLNMKSAQSAEDRLPEDLLALMAEIEREKILKRTKTGRRGKAKAGKWLGQNRPPFGYTAVNGDLVPDGDIDTDLLTSTSSPATVMWWCFSLYASGLTSKQIAAHFTDLGIPTPLSRIDVEGKRKQPRRAHSVWNRSSIARLLENSVYVGRQRQYRYTYENGREQRTTTPDTWVILDVPPIVSEGLWDTVQRMRKDAQKLAPRGAKHEYLVGRRIFCGHCGYVMRARAQDRQRIVYRYYACYQSPSEPKVRQCTVRLSVRANEIDDLVWDCVLHELTNPENVERGLREMQTEQRGGAERITAQIEDIVRRMKDANDKLLDLSYLRLPAHILNVRIDEESEKLERLDAEYKRLSALRTTPITDEYIEAYHREAEELHRTLAALETFEDKRDAIDSMDVRVTVRKLDDGNTYLNVSSYLQPEGVLLTVNTTSRNSIHSLQRSSTVLYRIREG